MLVLFSNQLSFFPPFSFQILTQLSVSHRCQYSATKAPFLNQDQDGVTVDEQPITGYNLFLKCTTVVAAPRHKLLKTVNHLTKQAPTATCLTLIEKTEPLLRGNMTQLLFDCQS